MTEQNAIVTTGSHFLAPVADVTTALRRYQAVKEFIGQVLKEGTDYGIVPGSVKPSLYKPGAEKMTAFFGFSVRFTLEDSTEDWTGLDHGGEPMFYYRYRCQLWRGETMVAEGEGSASSWESKYRYRQAERVCPACGKATIIKGKAEYGGGWLCYAKKGGCGAKFGDNDEQIAGQQLGRIKNPDPADVVNTLQKMAQKRALVAPVLIATNTSDYFTQDIEDFIKPGDVSEGQFRDESQPAKPARGPMSYETAIGVTNSEGKSYGDIETADLVHMANAMAKLQGTPKEKPEHATKLLAIQTILAARNAATSTEPETE